MTGPAVYVHEGDLTADHGPLSVEGGLVIGGSVRAHAVVEARGDIFVQGAVHAATVRSAGSVAVIGEVHGSPQAVATVEADGDIRCAGGRACQLRAGGDVLLGLARDCLIQGGGNLFLATSLAAGLVNVQLRLGGGVVPALDTGPLPEIERRLPTHTEKRRHARVDTRLQVWIAAHGQPPLRFRPCILHDLSVTGAGCRLLTSADAPETDMLVQLKAQFSGSKDQLFSIARVVRRSGPAVLGLEFTDMAYGDRQNLAAFLLRQTLSRTKTRTLKTQRTG